MDQDDPEIQIYHFSVMYADGKLIEGQPEGEDWILTTNILGCVDVYHRPTVAVATLEAALLALRTERERLTTTLPDEQWQALVVASIGRRQRMNMTYTGDEWLTGGRPDEPTYKVLDALPPFAVWYPPEISEATMLAVAQANSSITFHESLPDKMNRYIQSRMMSAGSEAVTPSTHLQATYQAGTITPDKPEGEGWEMIVVGGSLELYHRPGMTNDELLNALRQALGDDPDYP